MKFGRAVVLGFVLLAAVAAGGVVVGRVTTDGSGAARAETRHAPGEASVDVGFARDMGTHHAQAVLLANLVRDRTFDQTIRGLAGDIAATQQAQIGQMRGWLDVWGRPPTSVKPPMRWMGHGGMKAPARMPGMATAAEVARLRGTLGRPAEILFLQLMIRHHKGGIEMANYAAVNAQEPFVRSLARGIAAAQTSEVRYLTDLLARRGVRYRG